MSLVKELEPFAKELSLYRENNTLPQGDVKTALEDIYDKYAPKNRKWGVMKTQRGCPTCLSDAMKCLSAAFIDSLVDFKAIPQQRDLEELIEEVKQEAKVVEVVDYNSMAWGELKKYAASKGIKVKGKRKPEIIEELNKL